MKGGRIRKSNAFQTSNKIVDLDNENQWLLTSKKERRMNTVPPVEIMKYIL